MALKIVKGKQQTPVRGVIYGVEGIGKSTLAAQCPKAIVLDTEDGTHHLDCARVVCHDWLTLTDAMNELIRDAQGFASVVIDSADWAERILVDHLLKKTGKRSIEDFGFGKGFTMLAEEFGRLLGLCDSLVSRGINVIWVAHSKVVRTSPPDQDEGYDRWELKLTKQCAPLLREWCDLLLFANYRLKLVEGADGRTRAKGGKERVLFAERSAAWDAKNRFDLPPEMPMAFASIAAIFPTRPGGVLPPKGFAAPASSDSSQDGGAALVEKIIATIAAAKSVSQLGKIGDRIDELSSEGNLSQEEIAELLGYINRRHDELSPQKEVADAR
jgi:hypothetical protein